LVVAHGKMNILGELFNLAPKQCLIPDLRPSRSAYSHLKSNTATKSDICRF
jgi:hypothetical protein